MKVDGSFFVLIGEELLDKDAQAFRLEKRVEELTKQREEAFSHHYISKTQAEKTQAALDYLEQDYNENYEEVKTLRNENKELLLQCQTLQQGMRSVCRVLNGSENYEAFDMIGLALDARMDKRLMDWIDRNYNSTQHDTRLPIVTSVTTSVREAVGRRLSDESDLNHA